MSCEVTQRSLRLLLDGEDTAADDDAFAHLGACRECRAFMADALRARRAMQADREALFAAADDVLPAAPTKP